MLMSQPTLKFSKWFRRTFVTVGAIEVFFGCSSMLRGVQTLMAGTGVPDAVLNSAHYQDAMFWVMLHMTFIGIICLTVGLLASELRLQVGLSRVFVLFHAVYAFLDLRSSESPLGTALYHGPKSIVIPIISGILFLSMLHLAVRSFTVRIDTQ